MIGPTFDISMLAAVGFIHPALALAGAGCGAIPVIIHFLNRRRHKRVEWAAMRFLLLASRRSTRRLRLEQFFLLALRIAVVVFVGLLVSRPYFPATGLLPFSASGVHRVLVVDNSLSMEATTESGTRFERALHRAHDLLATFSPRDGVSIVTIADPATTVIDHPAYDRRVVAEAVDSIAATQRSTDVAGAIRSVMKIFADSPAAPGNRAVYFLSDFQKSVWLQDEDGTASARSSDSVNPNTSHNETGSRSASDVPTLAATELARLADTLSNPSENLLLVQVDGRERDNASLESLTADSAFVAPGLPVRFEATVANHGATMLRGARVQFRTGGRIVGESPVTELASGGQTVVTTTVQFPKAGNQTVEARLHVPGPDHLKVDDTRFFTIEVRDKTHVLIVDPKPSGRFNESEGAYLAAALDPASVFARNGPVSESTSPRTERDGWRDAVSPFSVEVSAQHELSFQALPEFDVVALCNVPALTRSNWNRLGRFVDQGGGLLVFLGDQVDVESYNHRNGSAEESRLLPARILEVVDVSESSALEGHDTSGQHAFLRLSRKPLTHPFVHEFARQENSGLFDARIEKYMRIEVDSAVGEVVWKYSNGEPAWVLGSRGRGRVLLCTTSANMRWNTLPAKGDYVSLMVNAVSFAMRGGGTQRNVVVGDRIRERLTALESSLPITVSPPADCRSDVSSTVMIRIGNGLGSEAGPVDCCGVWRLGIAGTQRDFSVNPDPIESRLAGAGGQELARAVNRKMRWMPASEKSLTGHEQEMAHTSEMSYAVLWMVIGLVAVESLLAMLFGKPLGHRRQDGAHA